MERLVLFDIDGTILAGGPAKEAFRVALVEVFGTAGAIEGHEFSGKTDPQIARELLTDAGLSAEEIDRGFPDLWSSYLEGLTRMIGDDPPAILPGVVDLLDRLETEERIALGLLTGNIAEGARIKLEAVGIATLFGVGAYGSDHEVRDRLLPVAVQRAREAWGIEFAPERTVVVGDTPRDVTCGRMHGSRTLAVATGRFSEEELHESGADHVVADLSGTAALVEMLTRG